MPTARKPVAVTAQPTRFMTCKKVLSWQTVDNTAYPHQVVIDLGKEYNVTGFRILPRAEQGAPGMIKDYKVYVKATGFGY